MNLYAFFHLNLMFSSIEEEDRPEVVRRCYWPLLKLAERFPLGLEASGVTLELCEAIDPAWMARLRALIAEGRVEFIGSGYQQIIGPLVPASVNRANQRLGLEVYDRLLGNRPRVALVNEQAFSSGLVPIYLDAGYEAIIMEWNNPALGHPEWDRAWKWYPQRAAGTRGTSIPVVWNESISFQKLQRYAHGEISLEEFVSWSSAVPPDGWYPVYGGDAEIFDFRPGRFATEPSVVGGEWERVAEAFSAVTGDWVLPSSAAAAASDRELVLTSAQIPVPVKKQGKYNVLRWAVTGRDDFGVNARCFALAASLAASGAGDEAWRELCYLWGSDFRTHITAARWEAFLDRVGAAVLAALPRPEGRLDAVERAGRFLSVRRGDVFARFNCRRGLALDRLEVGGEPLVGSLPHGHFEDIDLGADFYTGHLVFERPGEHKVADLNPVEPSVSGGHVSGVVETELGQVWKAWRVLEDGLELVVRLGWPETGKGSLRLGHLTLLSAPSVVRVAAAMGGEEAEEFEVSGYVDHADPVNALVSARAGVPITDGVIEFGPIRCEVSPGLVGLVMHRPEGFSRLVLTAQEVDETARGAVGRREFRVRISRRG